MKKTLGRALTEQMAAERRRVVSDWRALLLLRRATRQLAPEERRWNRAPTTLEEVHAILARLAATGEFRKIEEVPYVYEVQAPYARSGIIEEVEVLMEVHPYCALSHVTALVFHGLTDEFPQEIHALLPTGTSGGVSLPGVRQEDEETLESVQGRAVSAIFGHPVRWHRLSRGAALTGTEEYRPRGYPVRVTTPERTLVDGLLHPEWCGGIEKILRAWAKASDTLNVNALVELVDQFNVAVLRQRVGFILEQLGIEHPRVAQWPPLARRGGSSRLVGSAPFASDYSERWKLSINAPVGVLHEAGT